MDQILEDIEASAYAQGVKEWYDGYHFGSVDVLSMGRDELCIELLSGREKRTSKLLEKYERK